jgi:UPF0755 protein
MKRKKILYIFAVPAMFAIIVLFLLYRQYLAVNVFPDEKPVVIYIPTKAFYEQVIDSLKAHVSVRSWRALKLIADKKQYSRHIRPGRYVIDKELTYNELINILRSGRQAPVNVTFNNIRYLDQLAGKIGGKIEADSSSIMAFLSDPVNYSKDGFTRENIISVFIPNTYQFYWNTDARELYERMLTEYKKFWNEERLAKAKEKGLDPLEVGILASIIDDEVAKPDEKPRIAGVYLNRLKRGIPLQACPTIKFALNDFTITRVLYIHLQTDSPYNTYKHRGFPPGPIGCPSIEGIDAVLNAEEHDYLYFAARADFSGYHNFSRSLAEHNRYAAMYQRELDKRKIFK